MLKKAVVVCGVLSLISVIAFITYSFIGKTQTRTSLFDSFTATPSPTPEPPLQKYAIENLTSLVGTPTPLVIDEVIDTQPEFTSYLFHYQTTNASMSGQINVPSSLQNQPSAPMIIMARGYIPQETFETGDGTRPAAAYYAKHGFITVAPDFLGFGTSSPEPSDSWQARFEKPVQVLELLNSLQTFGISQRLPETQPFSIIPSKIGFWGHSNGGQIMLTALEALSQPIPTVLWAPVTAPFPYSIMFFSDEVEDEGKAMRKWVSIFEDTYNVFDFTLTKHLDRLTGPIQLHHGTADEAALYSWSLEFVDKVEAENKLRKNATDSAITTLAPVDLKLHTYPGADHNMRPSWDSVVSQDVIFFTLHLLEK